MPRLRRIGSSVIEVAGLRISTETPCAAYGTATQFVPFSLFRARLLICLSVLHRLLFLSPLARVSYLRRTRYLFCSTVLSKDLARGGGEVRIQGW